MQVLRRPALLLAVLTVVVLTVVGLASPASAHARLVTTEPAASAVLVTAPTELVLRFDEEVEPGLGGITLYDTDERPKDVGPAERVPGQPSDLRAAVLGDLADGTYVVLWRVTSADGHPVEGAFTFAVGNAGPGDTSGLVAGLLDRQGTTGASGILLGFGRFATFAGLALLIGGALFLALTWPSGSTSWPARRLLWFGWAVLLLAAAGSFLLHGVYATARPIGDLLDRDLWRVVAETRFGKAQLLRVVVLLAAVALLLDLRSCRRTVWRASAGVVAVVLAASVALAGHAGTGRWSGLGLVLDTVHVVAMAAWVGGVAMLAVVTLAPRTPALEELATADEDVLPLAVGAAVAPVPDALDVAVGRFSTFAFGAVAVVAASGVAQSLRMLDGLGELTSTAYGRTLLWKLVTVAIALAFAGVARTVVRRHWPAPARLRRAVAIELGTLVAVLAITAALVGMAPGVAGSGGQAFTASVVQGNVIADIAVTPAAVGPSEMHLVLTVPGGSLQPVQEAIARITLPSKGIGPIPVTLVPAGPNHFVSTGLQLPYDGDWSLEVLVTPTPGRQVRLETTLPVRG